MSDKFPLKNKTEFQCMCIVLSIPLNLMLCIFSAFYTIACLANMDWNFGFGVLGVVIFGMNTKSIFALMDYPDN